MRNIPLRIYIRSRLLASFALQGKMPMREERLKKMLDVNDPHEANILKALQAHIHHRYSAEENEEMNAAERIRAELLSSAETIMRTDFGSGAGAQGSVTRPAAVSELCRSSSKPPFYASLLFSIVRHCKPQQLLELGTCLGISALYETGALKLNGSGRLITLEGDPASAEIARKNLKKAGKDSYAEVITGKFTDTLPQLLGMGMEFDYAFIDGHHEGAATLAYLDMIAPHLQEGAILIFDDILYSEGMFQAWQQIGRRDDISISIATGQMGICIYKKRSRRRKRLSLII